MARNGDQSIRVPLAALAPDPRNARKMSDEARAGLGVSMETFGDLSVIVFNDRTGQIIGAHQRLERLRSAGAIEVVRNGNEGYVEHPRTRERFRVRFVDWDETKQRMANLVANNPHIAGEFTDEALAQLKELEDAEGFEELALNDLEEQLEGELEAAEKSASKDPRGRTGLEDFELEPEPVKAWILVATSSDRVSEIEQALRQFEGDDTRIEVSNG